MRLVLAGLVVLVAAACSSPAVPSTTTVTPVDVPTTTMEGLPTDTGPASSAPPVTTESTVAEPTDARPAWLGTRPLPLRPDGFGEALPTPPELAPRALATPDLLAPPSSDGYRVSIGPVPDDVTARSTWSPECPIDLEDLAYLTMVHHGFDGRLHTGEMIVDGAWATAVAEVFSVLFDAGYPIEEMRVIAAEELDAPPTGDGNVTTSFVCRPVVGSDNWSQHAYGRAIDVNPFHNPYVKGDLVLPELAGWYTDRGRGAPGMVVGGDAIVGAFSDAGWKWGGDWTTLKDFMHFSANGR